MLSLNFSVRKLLVERGTVWQSCSQKFCTRSERALSYFFHISWFEFLSVKCRRFFQRSSELVYYVTSLVCKLFSVQTTAPFISDNDGCERESEREGKVVCQSGSSLCVCVCVCLYAYVLFDGCGRIIATEFTNRRRVFLSWNCTVASRPIRACC